MKVAVLALLALLVHSITTRVSPFANNALLVVLSWFPARSVVMLAH
jgi:hypothetical protein